MSGGEFKLEFSKPRRFTCVRSSKHTFEARFGMNLSFRGDGGSELATTGPLCPFCIAAFLDEKFGAYELNPEAP